MTFNPKIKIPFLISFAWFMESIDTTVLNTAIPQMALSLNVNPVDLKIALISYLLSLAIFIPISGWIADKFGIKNVFTAALLIFTLSSIACGFSTTLISLVFWRAVQGLGGSLMMPVGRLILARTFQRTELIRTMSLVVTVAATAMMLGPVLGGLLTHYLSWHWIFWINIPFGILAMILSILWLKDYSPKPVKPLDKLGFILFGCGLSGLTFGLSAFSESAIEDWKAFSFIAISLVCLILYAIHSLKIKNPIIDIELFKIRTFRTSALGNILCRLSFGGIPFLLPLLLQITLGYSPQTAGLLLTPIAFGIVIAKEISLPLLKRFGFKKLLQINTIFVGLMIWSFMLITPQTSMWFIAILTFIYGSVISMQYTSMNSMAYSDLNHEQMSAATSITSTIMQLAISFGVAVSALLIRLFAQTNGLEFLLNLSVFHHVFLVLGILTIFSIFNFFQLKNSDGQSMLEKNAEKVVG